MTRAIVFGTLLLWALAAGAEARGWGFDKDTVYEWKAGGDTVRLVNDGVGLLKLDSIYAEEVNGRDWHHVSFFYRVEHRFSVSQWEPSAQVSTDSVPPGNVLDLYRFGVADILAKANASLTEEGDTLRVRLRFKSLSGEWDTLMVVGTCCGTSMAIRIMPGRSRSPEYGVVGRDILGRSARPPAKFPNLIRKIMQ